MAQIKAEAQAKAKSKNKGLKAMGIIVLVILIIAIIATVFVAVVTRKQKDTAENIKYVGGMLASDTIEYQSESAKGLEKNPVMKLMEMIWYFCADGDDAKHAKQTPPEVDMVKDIPYIDDGNLYHQLDVYYPQGIASTDKLPVIIDIHGGGWMYATKDLNEYYCRALADRGYTVFSMSYRLVPDVTVNEQLQDVSYALKWIHDNMENYPCDTDNIMLTGDSAGGMLAVYSTVLLQSPQLRETFDVVDAELDIDALLLTSPVSYMKDGAMSIYTKLLWGSDYKDKATYDYMNLDEIIDYADQLPPTYLITSSGDSLAHAQTLKAAELLKSKGVDTTLRDYEKYNGKSLAHVFSVLEPFDEIGTQTIDDALSFFKEITEKNKINE
ncbi:MAG: alpha/beta hydrolase [Clostridium sp.]|nr:alpha/beta hydrolase [Clostridium sp.]